MYNNAGILGTPEIGGILNIAKSSIEQVLNVNLIGPILGAKHAARVMIPKRKGCILFTASVAASVAGVCNHSYAVSKHGVVGLMKNLAVELGQFGIRVNSISPFGFASGITCNNMSPEVFESNTAKLSNLKGTILSAVDVAKGAVYLASDEANFVSGLDLVMDGGFSVVNPSFMMANASIQ